MSAPTANAPSGPRAPMTQSTTGYVTPSATREPVSAGWSGQVWSTGWNGVTSTTTPGPADRPWTSWTARTVAVPVVAPAGKVTCVLEAMGSIVASAGEPGDGADVSGEIAESPLPQRGQLLFHWTSEHCRN